MQYETIKLSTGHLVLRADTVAGAWVGTREQAGQKVEELSRAGVPAEAHPGPGQSFYVQICETYEQRVCRRLVAAGFKGLGSRAMGRGPCVVDFDDVNLARLSVYTDDRRWILDWEAAYTNASARVTVAGIVAAIEAHRPDYRATAGQTTTGAEQ